MRIGKFSRTHGIPVNEIIAYLEVHHPKEELNPNFKLREEVEADLLDHFGIEIEPPKSDEPEPEVEVDPIVEEEPKAAIEAPDKESEVLAPPTTPILTPEEEIAALDGELAPSEVREEVHAKHKEVVELKKEVPKEEEIIQSDQLIELLESEEAIEDLDKVKLIKAPKKELPGLKVVGKVDLPEPKKQPEKEDKEAKNKRAQKPKLSEEEREKRRLKAKAKKEAYEARQEKRLKQQEAQRKKELKAAHYQQRLKQVEQKKEKSIAKAQQPEDQMIKQKHKEPPKTIIGKFWRWLNT